MNFDVGDVLARAWQITWKHKILWVFNMFPVLLRFLFVPIFLIGLNTLLNPGFIEFPACLAAIMAFNLFLMALSALLYVSSEVWTGSRSRASLWPL